MSKNEISGINNFTPADIKYSTLGLGYIYYMNENIKALAWYDHIKNEHSLLQEYERDVNVDVFALRLQFQF